MTWKTQKAEPETVNKNEMTWVIGMSFYKIRTNVQRCNLIRNNNGKEELLFWNFGFFQFIV